MSIPLNSPTISRGKPRTLVPFACPRKKREKVRRNRLIIKNTYGGIDETLRWLLYLGLASEKLDGERQPLFRAFPSFSELSPSTLFVLRARSTTWRCGSQRESVFACAGGLTRLSSVCANNNEALILGSLKGRSNQTR